MKFAHAPHNRSLTENVTIIVNTCDSYNDVLRLFFKAFEEYWHDNYFPIVVNTESNPNLGYNKQEMIAKTWGERLLDTLNSIDSDYVLLLFDDFILEQKVDIEKIKLALNVLENDIKSSVFYLNVACLKDHVDDASCDYRKLHDNADYRLNSVPGLWKRKDLIRFTKPIDNPWSWETFGSYRTFNVDKNFYSASSRSNNIFNYNAAKGGAIYRGKWVREVVETKIRKYQLNIDLNERGVIGNEVKIERPILWKLNFIVLGFRSIGFKMFNFFFRQLLRKYFR